jgi:hypothetical protein
MGEIIAYGEYLVKLSTHDDAEASRPGEHVSVLNEVPLCSLYQCHIGVDASSALAVKRRRLLDITRSQKRSLSDKAGRA